MMHCVYYNVMHARTLHNNIILKVQFDYYAIDTAEDTLIIMAWLTSMICMLTGGGTWTGIIQTAESNKISISASTLANGNVQVFQAGLHTGGF